jgi:hypothetical protein
MLLDDFARTSPFSAACLAPTGTLPTHPAPKDCNRNICHLERDLRAFAQAQSKACSRMLAAMRKRIFPAICRQGLSGLA